MSTTIQPIEVRLLRGSIVESIHRVHAVVCDSKGRVLMGAGNTNYETFIRSALKPFQVIPFINSGTVEKTSCSDKSIAIACGSHSGTTLHAREGFRILWNSEIEVDALKCPIPEGRKSRLEHNCSGKHAAFLATCKKMNWPLENYLEVDHPLQKEIFRRVSDLLRIPSDEFVVARDDCGAPTLKLSISQMALLYAQLSNSQNADLEQVNRAITSNPILLAGNESFDTELIMRAHGQLISKGGAEGIQCLGRNGEGMGIAIKVEDGSKRAKHAVALHLLKQLDWLTPTRLQELQEKNLCLNTGVQLEVHGELRFQENTLNSE
ncbi:asparaginase [Prochlorococcus marinus]|uniref:L-asparaginase II n=1 Tax=Prochlorococcus marinus (strain MIT 9211) TaxID=93059 RepID=A9BAL5_PROM4|nr:asparaginase [Prochlorococcus marinus]ABX08877.1 L-asparaginase II [Prochlorococcus marinus str. MIT 9211]